MKQFLGIPVSIKNVPELDPGFIPMRKFYDSYTESAKSGVPVKIAVEREDCQFSCFTLKMHGTESMLATDLVMGERIIKSLLWSRGGFKVYIGGYMPLYDYIKAEYAKGGKREFDAVTMARVYEKDFEVVFVPLDKVPDESSTSKSIGRHLNGCRIGFDAGGSDRKVSAVIDGKAVWSEEVVWHPKVNENPDYHFDGILSAFRDAAAKMPRVDAIGVSSAGIYVNNRTMLASLFIKVPEKLFNEKVKDIYVRAAAEIGDVPLVVANDGDVTALAGAMNLNDTNVLGIAMGTSEAGGFVDGRGNITGCLNELAFMPVDLNPDAMIDEWSLDIGCGVKYFSQDGVIKLAGYAGIDLSAHNTPAEKLKYIQSLMEKGNQTVKHIYESIGVYLGHTLAWYSVIYDIKHVLLLGRVMSGEGGNIILEKARHTIADEYPEYSGIEIHLPDEASRRIGQSVAAASLPEVNNA
ncbi:MAG: ROK family protein [Clostridiales bacterium]|nr:ROK family protein [Clostridiales bacterium]